MRSAEFHALSIAMIYIMIPGCGESRHKDPSEPAPDSLVVGAGADEFGLKLNRARLGRYPLNTGICEPILRLTADFNTEPALASRWEFRGDNTYRFVLRREPRFHDGTPLSADAVKYTLDQGIREKTQYSFLGNESVRVVDDSTIDIRPLRPNLRLLEQMSHFSYATIVLTDK